MGCNSSKSIEVMQRRRKEELVLGYFRILVELPKVDPEEEGKLLEFKYDAIEDQLPLVTIMNSLAFEGGERGRKFDANFASRIDPKRGEFEYFV